MAKPRPIVIFEAGLWSKRDTELGERSLVVETLTQGTRLSKPCYRESYEVMLPLTKRRLNLLFDLLFDLPSKRDCGKRQFARDNHLRVGSHNGT